MSKVAVGEEQEGARRKRRRKKKKEKKETKGPGLQKQVRSMRPMPVVVCLPSIFLLLWASGVSSST